MTALDPVKTARVEVIHDRLLAAIDEARAHLMCALAQVLETDDQIIVGHMRSALGALDGARRGLANRS